MEANRRASRKHLFKGAGSVPEDLDQFNVQIARLHEDAAQSYGRRGFAAIDMMIKQDLAAAQKRTDAVSGVELPARVIEVCNNITILDDRGGMDECSGVQETPQSHAAGKGPFVAHYWPRRTWREGQAPEWIQNSSSLSAPARFPPQLHPYFRRELLPNFHLPNIGAVQQECGDMRNALPAPNVANVQPRRRRDSRFGRVRRHAFARRVFPTRKTESGAPPRQTSVSRRGVMSDDNTNKFSGLMDNKYAGAAAGLFAAAVLGFGLILAGLAVGNGIVSSRLNDRNVTVRGVSERNVVADIAFWPIRYSSTGDDLTGVQRTIDADTQTVRKFLEDQGFKPDEIALGQLEVTDNYANGYQQNVASRYVIAQTVNVRTTSVQRVTDSYRKTGDLVRRGVVFSSWQGPSYVFTKLNEVKPEMIAEATKSAREGALQFANDSGSRLGGIKDATQGYFEIQPRDQGENSIESQQVNKTVRVVTTVTYRLK